MSKGLKRKVRLKLHELSEVEVNYVSLVPRGANRLPFKVLKHDTSEQGEMIRFTKKPTQEQDMSASNTTVNKTEEKPTEKKPVDITKFAACYDEAKKEVKQPPAEKPADMSDEEWAAWLEAWKAHQAAGGAAAAPAPEMKTATTTANGGGDVTTSNVASTTADVKPVEKVDEKPVEKPAAPAQVTIKAEDIAAAVLAALAPFKTQLEGLANSVQTINSSINGVQKRIDEVEKQAQSVEKAMKSTIVSSGAPAPETPATTKKDTQKGESVWKGALPGFPD